MNRVDRDCSLSPIDWEFYNVYSSEYNKESLEYLRFGMSLPEFLTHKEFIEIRISFEEEQRLEAERARKKTQRK